MHPAFEIESQIRDYLSGRVSLEKLRSWFRVNKGAILTLPPSTKPLELATTLLLGLTELDRGDFSPRQLKRELRLALDQTFQVTLGSPSVMTTASNETTAGLIVSLPDGIANATTVVSHRLITAGR
jgi:hypothetical protein